MVQFIVIIILIVAVLLILAVLAQSSKGSGLAGGLSNSGASQIMGAKRTSDFLEKATWGFIIGVFALSLLVNVLDMGKPTFGSPNLDAAKGKSVKKETAAPQDQKALEQAIKDAQKQEQDKMKVDSAKQ